MEPTSISQRLHLLDVLRGFALLGIIFVNIPALLHVVQPATEADARYYFMTQFFIENKFFTIFSFLFGVGFYIFLSRAKAKGDAAYKLFTRRMLLLLLLGLLHTLWQPGEALSIYAVFGLVVMACYTFPKEINVVVGASLLLLFTAMTIKVFMPLPLILLGLAAGQYGVFTNIEQHQKRWVQFTAVMFIISFAASLYAYMQAPPLSYFDALRAETVTDGDVASFLQLMTLSSWAAPFISSFYVGVMVLLYTSPLRQLFYPLQQFGRMALTNYLLQTACIVIGGYVLQLKGSITYTQSALFCIVVLIVLMVFSQVWLRYFRYGPFEWLWRIGTYGKLLPAKNKKHHTTKETL